MWLLSSPAWHTVSRLLFVAVGVELPLHYSLAHIGPKPISKTESCATERFVRRCTKLGSDAAYAKRQGVERVSEPLKRLNKGVNGKTWQPRIGFRTPLQGVGR